MPGGNGPVELVPLAHPGDRAFRALVRFPAGWERPGPGHYAVPEEFLVLAGELSIGEVTWTAGGYAWIPARRTRTATLSRTGCVAFAWFGGLPRWVPGSAALPADGENEHFAHWRESPRRTLRDGALIRELRIGPEHATWIVEPCGDSARVLPVAGCESLDLDTFRWTAGTPATPDTPTRSPLLVRGTARPA